MVSNQMTEIHFAEFSFRIRAFWRILLARLIAANFHFAENLITQGAWQKSQNLLRRIFISWNISFRRNSYFAENLISQKKWFRHKWIRRNEVSQKTYQIIFITFKIILKIPTIYSDITILYLIAKKKTLPSK